MRESIKKKNSPKNERLPNKLSLAISLRDWGKIASLKFSLQSVFIRGKNKQFLLKKFLAKITVNVMQKKVIYRLYCVRV